jgi:NapC/NirT cytochrome c family, N-terminal region
VSSDSLGRDENESSVDEVNPETTDAPAAETEPRSRKRVRTRLRGFFRPAHGSSRWRRMLPWATVVVLVIIVVVASLLMWTWTNSPSFCGTTCHTMPPQYTAYELSPHSRVTCVECHIGRGPIWQQVGRKTPHARFVFQMAFGLYEYPIFVKGMRPARDACETCHAPTKFSDDSVVVKKHYATDENNSAYDLTLIMHIGGGTQREGLGRGIHWHTEANVQFLSTDSLDQNIPYIKVTNTDGSVNEYVDVEANIDPSNIDPKSLKTMDCITCHNRISHEISEPDASVENAMARGVISAAVPYIRSEAVTALTAGYTDREQAFAGIAQTLDTYYKTSYPDFYATDKDKIDAAIAEVQRIWTVSVFPDQLLDWNTHPDNVGHIDSPGCFRCHDGKHLDASKQAIRLECNLCHSVPVVSTDQDRVTRVEISNGPEPPSHLNANWISLHNVAYLRDKSCANCHTTADDGGTSNTSFCSNSACHGTVYKYAGFNAPALRDTLREQLPTPSAP